MKSIKSALLWIAGIPKSKTWWSFFLMVAAIGTQDDSAKAVLASAIAIIYWMPEKVPATTVSNVTIQDKGNR